MSTPDYLTRLEALEQKVAGLQSAQIDSIQPNLLRINPDGSIGALLAGGVEIPEAGLGAQFTPTDAVSWIDSLGVIRGFIQTAGDPVLEVHEQILEVQADATDFAAIELQAQQLGFVGNSVINLVLLDHSGAAQNVRLLGSDGASGFMRLSSIENVQAQKGTVACTFPGGTATSTPTAIAFSPIFAAVIDAIFLGVNTPSGITAPLFATYTAESLTGMTVEAADPFGTPPNGTTVNVSYLVLGR